MNQRDILDQDIRDLQDSIDAKKERVTELENERDAFDVSEHVDESDFKEQFEHETIEVYGITMQAMKILEKMDYTAFRESFNNWIDSLEPDGFEEYRAIEEELEEVKDELLDMGDELDELHSQAWDMDNAE